MKSKLAAVLSRLTALIRKWWKRALVYVVVAFVLALGLEGLQLLTQPKLFEERTTGAVEWGMLDTAEAEVSGCTFDGTKISVDGEGAEITFRPEKPVQLNHIVIYFHTYATAGGEMRLFFAVNGEGFTEENAVISAWEAGSDEVNFEIPRTEYSALRFQVNGNADIGSVEYSNAEIERIVIPEEIQWKRVIKIALVILAVMCFLTGIHGGNRLKKLCGRTKDNLMTDRRNTLVHIAVFIAAAGIAYLLLRVYIPYAMVKPLNRISHLFIISVAIAVGCLFCFRETLAKKAEVFFLIFTLLIGGNMAFFAADTSTISWDDGYHYMQANAWSYVSGARITTSDSEVLTPWAPQEYDTRNLDAWHAEQDEGYRIGASSMATTGMSLKNFWSASSALGLYLGRVLQLPFHWIWELGRFFGLLAYAVIGYFAIRRLKSGKIVLAAVLMIPENLFLAASYSYDPGTTVLMALGFSYLLAEWQEPEKKLTWFNSVVMIGAMFLAGYTKGVYMPVLLIPLFLPKAKFADRKQRLLFMGMTVAAMIALVLTTVLPMLSVSSGMTDTRGGDDTSTQGQIAFILSNPLRYTEILLTYLKGFLHPDGIADFFSFFAYKGKAPNYNIYLIALVIAAFTDKEECDEPLMRRGWLRAWFMLVIFGTVCLVATSMYIIFTPVGHPTVNGCQFRYILPLFYPAIMLLGFSGICNKANRMIYNGVLFGLIGYVGFVSAFLQFINLYY